jgi:hypothetical protein
MFMIMSSIGRFTGDGLWVLHTAFPVMVHVKEVAGLGIDMTMYGAAMRCLHVFVQRSMIPQPALLSFLAISTSFGGFSCAGGLSVVRFQSFQLM